jgi:hypothetical protein
MGMTDENSVKMGKCTLGQMVNLTTVKQQMAAIGAGPYQQDRVIKQSGEEGRYEIAKGKFRFHANPSLRKLQNLDYIHNFLQTYFPSALIAWLCAISVTTDDFSNLNLI